MEQINHIEFICVPL